MLTTEKLERRFRREFAFWEIVPLNDGWDVRLFVDGEEVTAHIGRDMGEQDVTVCMQAVFQHLGEIDEGEYPEGGLH